MKNKKDLLKFLEGQEIELVKAAVVAEIDVRTASSFYLTSPKNDKYNAANLKAKSTQEYIEKKLEKFREVVKEIKEDRLVI